MAEEKVELSEQTPLKQDTEAAAETTEAGEAAPAAPKKTWWFSKKGKKEEKPAGEGEAEPAEKPAEGSDPAAKKKCCHWWQKKPCCKATEAEGGPSFGVDLIHRDEQQLQTVIELGFGDIFAEADAVHSLNGVWNATHSIFTAVRNFFYKVFTVILFAPAAILFGVLFALVSAIGVFVIVPAGKLLSIPAVWIFKLWGYIVSSVLEPIGVGISHIFSKIKVHRYGIHNDVTATLNP